MERLTQVTKGLGRVWDVLPKLPKCRVGYGKSYSMYPTLPGYNPSGVLKVSMTAIVSFGPSYSAPVFELKTMAGSMVRADVEVAPAREITSTSATV